ncbi:hypothetical protein H1215_09765, partial [Anoxybacillus sp. LAT_38]
GGRAVVPPLAEADARRFGSLPQRNRQIISRQNKSNRLAFAAGTGAARHWHAHPDAAGPNPPGKV